MKLTDIESLPRVLQWFILTIRALIRPFVTLAVTCAYCYCVLQPSKLEYLKYLHLPFIIVLLFWFGERVLSRTNVIDIFSALLLRRGEKT